MGSENQIISKLLKDVENSSLDHKLAYVLGRYVELRNIYQNVSWYLTTEMLRGGISGAQVIVGFLNADLFVGLFTLVSTIGSIVFAVIFPEHRIIGAIATIISAALTVASLGHYYERTRKGTTTGIPQRRQ